MKDFAGRTAVITGGGTGMGRQLALQLAAEGCNVAVCDVSPENMAQTRELALSNAPQGTRVSTFVADVSIEEEVLAFAASVARDLDTGCIHLLINNAGIGGGGSIVDGDRAQWEKTFNVCWYGVYYCTLAFLPLLMKAGEARIVNMSSVNGFWASIGPNRPHSAYCAAKFAVKGFTEALLTDLALSAPHIKCSVVMPGHIGTEIVRNSRMILSGGETTIDAAAIRKAISAFGVDASALSDGQVIAFAEEQARRFRDDAPTTAQEAARIILDGVKADKWRILVGRDAEFLDVMVRAKPEDAYSATFYETLIKETKWAI